jgi:hypothetical protein
VTARSVAGPVANINNPCSAIRVQNSAAVIHAGSTRNAHAGCRLRHRIAAEIEAPAGHRGTFSCSDSRGSLPLSRPPRSHRIPLFLVDVQRGVRRHCTNRRGLPFDPLCRLFCQRTVAKSREHRRETPGQVRRPVHDSGVPVELLRQRTGRLVAMSKEQSGNAGWFAGLASCRTLAKLT